MGQCVARDLGLGNVDKTLKETTLYKKMHEVYFSYRQESYADFYWIETYS